MESTCPEIHRKRANIRNTHTVECCSFVGLTVESNNQGNYSVPRIQIERQLKSFSYGVAQLSRSVRVLDMFSRDDVRWAPPPVERRRRFSVQILEELIAVELNQTGIIICLRKNSSN